MVQTERGRRIFRSVCVKPVRPAEFFEENSGEAVRNDSTDSEAEVIEAERMKAMKRAENEKKKGVQRISPCRYRRFTEIKHVQDSISQVAT